MFPLECALVCCVPFQGTYIFLHFVEFMAIEFLVFHYLLMSIASVVMSLLSFFIFVIFFLLFFLVWLEIYQSNDCFSRNPAFDFIDF